MSQFQQWLEEQIRTAGGWTKFQTKVGVTPGRLLGWRRGSLPEPAAQIKLAEATGEPLDKIKDLVWQTQLGGSLPTGRS